MEINLTTSYVGFLSLTVFFIAYAVVMAEEFSHLRKSKPVILSAAIIWGIIAFYFSGDKSYSKEISNTKEYKYKSDCIFFMNINTNIRLQSISNTK